MHTRRFRRLSSLLLVVSLVAAACGGDDDESASDETGAEVTAPSADGAETTAPAEVDPVTVSVGSAFMGYGAWWIADGAELFDKHGVEVNVTTYAGAGTAMAAIAAEQIDVMANSVGLGITGVSQGLPIKFIYTLSDLNHRSMSVVGSTEHATFEDVKAAGDCTISGTIAGSAPLGFTNQVIETQDLTGCEMVVGNDMPGVLSLVASGQADWGTVFPSQAQVAKDAGQVNILYDAYTASDEEGETLIPNSFLFGGIITTEDVIEEKRESLVRMLAALDEAYQMIQDASAEELAEITKRVEEPWLATPIEVLTQEWELAKGFVRDGSVDEEQWVNSLEGYQRYIQSPVIDPAAPDQQFGEVVDMSLLDEAISRD